MDLFTKKMKMTVNERERKVREFHEKFGSDVDHDLSYSGGTLGLLDLRLKLIREEFYELEDAAEAFLVTNTKNDLENILKELADLQYVVSGFAVSFGLPLEEAFNRVHESNMSKLGEDGKPLVRADGKILKSKNYVPPDLSDLVK